jgi:vesicle coat complex subunit
MLQVDYIYILLALLLGGDFFTGTVLAAALTKLVLRFADLSPDEKKANSLRAEAMLIMTSTIRVGQSKFSSAPIDEDSNERILNCIQTLSELQVKPVVHGIFLNDTKAAYSKMVAAQEVCLLQPLISATDDKHRKRRQRSGSSRRRSKMWCKLTTCSLSGNSQRKLRTMCSMCVFV